MYCERCGCESRLSKELKRKHLLEQKIKLQQIELEKKQSEVVPWN